MKFTAIQKNPKRFKSISKDNFIIYITVGIGKDYLTVNEAITAAWFRNTTIIIDKGTYNEHLDLTTKRIDFVGSGNLETIIHYSINAPSAFSTINMATNCTFTNILIDKREASGIFIAAKPIVNISNCTPTFINCQIGRTIYVDGYNSQKPMTISNGSIVNMVGCIITMPKNCLGLDPEVFALLVQDISKLYFEGTIFRARLHLKDTAKAYIDTDYLHTYGNINSIILFAENNSKLYVKVNIREVYWDTTTDAEKIAGFYSSLTIYGIDNAYIEISGNQLTGGYAIAGAGNVILFKDVISTLGHFWFQTGGVALTALCTFDNCQIMQDYNNDVMGSHIIEETVGTEIRLINGTILEFSGHQGNWFTMGNPVVCKGNFYMRDSEVIDNCNDNFPFGINYEGVLLLHNKFDLENSIITNQNWDGISGNNCIRIQKDLGTHINCRLKNVTFNNSEINTVPIAMITAMPGYDANDYICEQGSHNNSTAILYEDQEGGGLISLAFLQANCP